jgi:hypothetical protein
MSTDSLQVMDKPIDNVLAQKVRTILLNEKPLTVREITRRLDKREEQHITGILDEMTTHGIIARFRAGLSQYYASPRVALTEENPKLGTIISDSLKSLIS